MNTRSELLDERDGLGGLSARGGLGGLGELGGLGARDGLGGLSARDGLGELGDERRGLRREAAADRGTVGA